MGKLLQVKSVAAAVDIVFTFHRQQTQHANLGEWFTKLRAANDATSGPVLTPGHENIQCGIWLHEKREHVH